MYEKDGEVKFVRSLFLTNVIKIVPNDMVL